MSEDPAEPAHESDSDAYNHPSPNLGSGDARGQRRRRRPVADWGGDDLFTHVPRRRFSRSVTTAPPRRAGAVPVGANQSRRSGEAALVPPLGPDHRAHFDADDAVPAARRSTPRPPVVVHEQRPTGVRGVDRRRRAVDERGLPRPDRVAAWAFMLGLLLVLLAVGTADAAVFALF